MKTKSRDYLREVVEIKWNAFHERFQEILDQCSIANMSIAEANKVAQTMTYDLKQHIERTPTFQMYLNRYR